MSIFPSLRLGRKIDMASLPPKYDPTGSDPPPVRRRDQRSGRSRTHRDFYKVEKWTQDGTKVDHMLYAGSNLDKARAVFAAAIYHRPRIRLTDSTAVAGVGAMADVDAVAAEGPKRQTTGALARRSFRRSIRFRLLAWRRSLASA